jgi:hypothetical protein
MRCAFEERPHEFILRVRRSYIYFASIGFQVAYLIHISGHSNKSEDLIEW